MEEKNTQENIVNELAYPMFAGRNWLKLLGIVMIVMGSLYALTIVGIIFAWLPIWMGVLLYQAAEKVSSAYYSGDKAEFIMAQRKLTTYFTINGILMLVGIGIWILAMIVLFSIGFPDNFQDLIQNQDFY